MNKNNHKTNAFEITKDINKKHVNKNNVFGVDKIPTKSRQQIHRETAAKIQQAKNQPKA